MSIRQHSTPIEMLKHNIKKSILKLNQFNHNNGCYYMDETGRVCIDKFDNNVSIKQYFIDKLLNNADVQIVHKFRFTATDFLDMLSIILNDTILKLSLDIFPQYSISSNRNCVVENLYNSTTNLKKYIKECIEKLTTFEYGNNIYYVNSECKIHLKFSNEFNIITIYDHFRSYIADECKICIDNHGNISISQLISDELKNTNIFKNKSVHYLQHTLNDGICEMVKPEMMEAYNNTNKKISLFIPNISKISSVKFIPLTIK